MMHSRRSRFWVLLLSLLWACHAGAAPDPHWIWDSTSQDEGKRVLYFRKVFTVKKDVRKAMLTVDADDGCDFFVNGKKVATVTDWHTPANVDVTKHIVQGENVLAARVHNDVSAGGVVARLSFGGSDSHGKKRGKDAADSIVTGTNWLYADHESPGWNTLNFDATSWKPAVSEGKAGVDPWGNVFAKRQATLAESLTVMPGFKVELLHSADASEGSWISMAADDKGRLIVSPQSEGKLLRITLARGKVDHIEPIDQPVTSAMGMLYAKQSLFINGHGPKGTGIYRLRDGGNKFEAPVLLRSMDGEGEHGSHGLVLGPDNKLYIVSGNFTKVPKDILAKSPLKNYADDQLLPRAPDGRGFGNGLLPPGGFVLRMDLDGSNAELFAAGTRNTYDIAFSPDGELFGFDSDMEWDWGTSWYRPIRVNHWVSGGDYGFREGTGKFPEYYEDTLPANFDVGVGSPTGVKFATESQFPGKIPQRLFHAGLVLRADSGGAFDSAWREL